MSKSRGRGGKGNGKRVARVGAAAFALGLSLAGPQAGSAAADASEDGSAASASSGSDSAKASSQRAGRPKASVPRRGTTAARSAEQPATSADVPAGAGERAAGPAAAVSAPRAAAVVPEDRGAGADGDPGRAVSAPVVAGPAPSAATPAASAPKAAATEPAGPAPATPAAVAAVTSTGGSVPVADWASAAALFDGSATERLLEAPAPVAAKPLDKLHSEVQGFFTKVHHFLVDLARQGGPLGQLGANLEGVLLIVRNTFFNRGPTLNPVQRSVTESGQVVGTVGGFDAEGDLLSYQVTGNPQNGTVELTADGKYTFTPGPGFTGMDSFSVQAVSDGSGINLFNLPAGTRQNAEMTIPVGANGHTHPFMGTLGSTAPVASTHPPAAYYIEAPVSINVDEDNNATISLTVSESDLMSWQRPGANGTITVGDAWRNWGTFVGNAGDPAAVMIGVEFTLPDGTEQTAILNSVTAVPGSGTNDLYAFTGNWFNDPDDSPGTGSKADTFYDIIGVSYKDAYENFRARYGGEASGTPFDASNLDLDINAAKVYFSNYTIDSYNQALAGKDTGETISAPPQGLQAAASNTNIGNIGLSTAITATLSDGAGGFFYATGGKNTSGGKVYSWQANPPDGVSDGPLDLTQDIQWQSPVTAMISYGGRTLPTYGTASQSATTNVTAGFFTITLPLDTAIDFTKVKSGNTFGTLSYGSQTYDYTVDASGNLTFTGIGPVTSPAAVPVRTNTTTGLLQANVDLGSALDYGKWNKPAQGNLELNGWIDPTGAQRDLTYDYTFNTNGTVTVEKLEPVTVGDLTFTPPTPLVSVICVSKCADSTTSRQLQVAYASNTPTASFANASLTSTLSIPSRTDGTSPLLQLDLHPVSGTAKLNSKGTTDIQVTFNRALCASNKACIDPATGAVGKASTTLSYAPQNGAFTIPGLVVGLGDGSIQKWTPGDPADPSQAAGSWTELKDTGWQSGVNILLPYKGRPDVCTGGCDGFLVGLNNGTIMQYNEARNGAGQPGGFYENLGGSNTWKSNVRGIVLSKTDSFGLPTFAVGLADGSVRQWNNGNGSTTSSGFTTIRDKSGSVTAMMPLADDFYVGFSDGSVWRQNNDTGEWKQLPVIPTSVVSDASAGEVRTLVPYGSGLVAGLSNGRVMHWTGAGWKQFKDAGFEVKTMAQYGSVGLVVGTGACNNNSGCKKGENIQTTGEDLKLGMNKNGVIVWDGTGWEVLQKRPGDTGGGWDGTPSTTTAIGNNQLVVGLSDGNTEIWDGAKWTVLAKTKLVLDEDTLRNAVAYAQGGGKAVANGAVVPDPGNIFSTQQASLMPECVSKGCDASFYSFTLKGATPYSLAGKSIDLGAAGQSLELSYDIGSTDYGYLMVPNGIWKKLNPEKYAFAVLASVYTGPSVTLNLADGEFSTNPVDLLNLDYTCNLACSEGTGSYNVNVNVNVAVTGSLLGPDGPLSGELSGHTYVVPGLVMAYNAGGKKFQFGAGTYVDSDYSDFKQINGVEIKPTITPSTTLSWGLFTTSETPIIGEVSLFDLNLGYENPIFLDINVQKGQTPSATVNSTGDITYGAGILSTLFSGLTYEGSLQVYSYTSPNLLVDDKATTSV